MPRPLTDPATRLELRDECTCAWHECSEDDPIRVRADHVAQYLRSRGYGATVELRPHASSPVTVNAIYSTGSGEVLALVWEPAIDGFDYEESGDDADAIDGPPPDSLLSPDPAEPEPEEPETATCDGCENAFPVDEVEIMGNADHGPFGFCPKCRAP